MRKLLILGVVWGLTVARSVNIQKQHSNILDIFRYPLQKYDSNKPLIRIVGGQEASPHQFPYQVGIYITYALTTAFCGGSLVSTNYVLTAAHCAEGAISLEIILGAHNISDESETTIQRQTTTTYVVHPNWDSSNLVNDIALVKLVTPAVENEDVSIIKLASANDSFAGSTGTVSGWGKTTDGQVPVTDVLRYTTNPILSNIQCKDTSNDYNAVIKDSHICLSGDGDKSICNGDSGGPLVSNGIQVGISSFNYKTCEASMPSVFTRVTEFSEWIRNNSDVTFEAK